MGFTDTSQETEERKDPRAIMSLKNTKETESSTTERPVEQVVWMGAGGPDKEGRGRWRRELKTPTEIKSWRVSNAHGTQIGQETKEGQ